ncbi:hypothetical protein MAR_002210 [Mya arenaria]|uniref:NACHT domain-containing protein n=1 Tax=Mya arenaria TaxID=6604 RepID=A0ABY7FFK5_MYAAR|nr:hypothetical protein MAR_002210 [Mya arenaria]
MSNYKQLFQEKKNQNWLKASVAFDITRKGLIPFVKLIVTILQQTILAKVKRINFLTSGATCNICTTPNVLTCRTRGVCGSRGHFPCSYHKNAKPRKCPANICNAFMSEIKDYHRFRGPSWKNTNANAWCSNPWEVAKCFLPPDGYLNVQTADDTDINGIISFIINCKFSQTYFTADLSKDQNICTTALLQDSKHLATEPSAKDALAKLAQLENDQLRISTDDLENVIRNAIATTSELLLKEHCLQKKMDELKVFIQVVTEDAVQKSAHAEKEKDLKRYRSKSTALKQDLQKHYLDSCSSFDLGPMFATDSPNLVEVYTPPQLLKLIVTKVPDSTTGVNSKIVRSEVKKLDEVFRNTGEQAKHIYITAKAGVGKSSFCKFIARLWCAFQANDINVIEILKSRGAGTYLNDCEELQNVQFVFYARLVQSNSRLCEMDDIVYHQIIRRLSRCEYYDMKFLQEILDKEHCLMIFDGLDEWSHPDAEKNVCFAGDTEAPHERSRENCTVMITSRHWKLGLQKMDSKKTNICVEIEEFDNTNICPLIEQAFKLLAGDFEQTKDVEDFFLKIFHKDMRNVLSSTLVALQLLSLWYKGHSLGESKCQVYCNVLEMMFANVLKRNPHVQNYLVEEHRKDDCLMCLQTRHNCMRFQEYIRSLGKIAFFSLFDFETLERQMERKFATLICTRNVEEIGLLSGLLLKRQIHSSSVNPRYEYSFLHKTYQELLACIYIASMYKKKEHKLIAHIIKLSSQTLSFEMMLFLCGMHGRCASVIFEIYCDLQTNTLCQRPSIDHHDVRLFRETCVRICKEMKTEYAIKSRILLLGDQISARSTIPYCKSIQFLILELNDENEIDMFDNIQKIVENCKTRMCYIRIKNNLSTDCVKPLQIIIGSINACINLHTLYLKNLYIDGIMDLTACSSLSCLEFSHPKTGKPFRLIISPNRLKICRITFVDCEDLSAVRIKCTCPFNSEVLECLELCSVRLEDELRLSEFVKLKSVCLLNVDTTEITIRNSEIEHCVFGGTTDPAVIKDVLKSKSLKTLRIAYFDDNVCSSLNETLSSSENIEELSFFHSCSPLIHLHMPISVREFEFKGVILTASLLRRMIKNIKTKHSDARFYFDTCYLSPSDEVTIETIVEEIEQCSQCILNDKCILREDEMKTFPTVGEINVAMLDFEITSYMDTNAIEY